MVKVEDRLTYGETCQIAHNAFNKFNGWINPSCKAYRIIFDVNNDNLLAMALGNIIVFFPHNVLKFYYEELKVDLDKKQMKAVIIFLVVHELGHLEQDLGLYEDMYRHEEELIDIVEGSNNANTYNYLVAAQRYGILDKDLDLFWPGFWYTNMDTEEKYKDYLSKYYRVPSMITKAIYCLSLLCYGTRSDIKQIVKAYNTVEVEYREQDNIIVKEMIKINNMYVHPDKIMIDLVDFIFLRIYQGFQSGFNNQVAIVTKDDYVRIVTNNTNPIRLLNVVAKIR